MGETTETQEKVVKMEQERRIKGYEEKPYFPSIGETKEGFLCNHILFPREMIFKITKVLDGRFVRAEYYNSAKGELTCKKFEFTGMFYQVAKVPVYED